MASNINPAIFPHYRVVRKRDLREQFSITKQEIEALQNGGVTDILEVSGVGEAVQDGIAINEAIIKASEENLLLVFKGTFVVSPSEIPAWTYAKLYPVHICCYLKSNLKVDAREARFFVDTRKWPLIQSFHRVFIFGTPHSVNQGQLENITWIGGVFDFTETYGVGLSTTYCFGLVGVDDFHIQDATVYYPTWTSSHNRRGRGIFAHNCRRRSSNNMRFVNTVQAYVTRFDYDFRDTDIYGEGYAEFYDIDQTADTGIIENVILHRPVTDDDAFDCASASNIIINNVVIDEGYAGVSFYTKHQTSWDTYEHYFNMVGYNNEPGGSADNNPIVSIAIDGTITWPDDGYDYSLVANGRVTFTVVDPGTLPTGFSDSTLYYIVNGSVSGRSCKVSTSEGGSAVVPSDLGSGVFRAIRFPSPTQTTSCRNNIVSNLIMKNSKLSNSPMIMVAAYQYQFSRAGLPRQCDNITLENITLHGGNGIQINEGQVHLKNIVLQDSRPATGTDMSHPRQRAALMIRQILSGPQTVESWVDAYATDITINNCLGPAVVLSCPRNLFLDRVTIDGYALRDGVDDVHVGIYAERMGDKTGRIHIGDVVIKTTVENCIDMNLNEYVSASPYTFTQGIWQLLTTASGVVHLDLNNFYPISEPLFKVHIPAVAVVDQGAGSTTPIWGSLSQHLQVFGVDCYTHQAQTASTDYSTIRLRKSTAGSPVGSLTGSAFRMHESTLDGDLTRGVEVVTSDADALIHPQIDGLVYDVIIGDGSGADPTPAAILMVRGLLYQTT